MHQRQVLPGTEDEDGDGVYLGMLDHLWRIGRSDTPTGNMFVETPCRLVFEDSKLVLRGAITEFTTVVDIFRKDGAARITPLPAKNRERFGRPGRRDRFLPPTGRPFEPTMLLGHMLRSSPSKMRMGGEPPLLATTRCTPRPLGQALTLLGFLVLFGGAADLPRARADEARTLRVGVYENRPKIFTDSDGKPAGIFINLLEEIAHEESWKLEYVRCSWAECLALLEGQQLDLMPDVGFSTERGNRFDINRVSALTHWTRIVQPRGGDIDTILDLARRKVAVLDNSIQHDSLRQLINSYDLFGCDLVPVADFEEGFARVRSGEVDAAVVNQMYMMAHGMPDGLEYTHIVFLPARFHFAAARGTQTDVLAAIDARLEAWKLDSGSVYFRILSAWDATLGTPPIPRQVWIALGGSLSGALVLALLALFLRRQVRVRTQQLAQKAEDLEQALASLRAAQDELIRGERAQAFSRLATGVAHDFNNCLTPIVGLSSTMLAGPERYSLSAGALDNVRLICDAASDGVAMVRRMQAAQGGQYRAQDLEPVAPGALLRDVAELVRPRLRTGEASAIALEVDVVPCPKALISASDLREILLNLVSNAIDAMPSGGSLALKLEPTEGEVTIVVEDSGIGMDPDTRGACMRPFFTTKGAKGSGIGLAMVMSIITGHGGRVEVESELGTGTRFTLIVPAAK